MKKQPQVLVTDPAMVIEWRPLADIHPYPKNARVIPAAAIAKVAQSIQQFGWRQPIVVDVHSVIVAGHVRLLAAQQLGLERAPVHVAVDLTPEQIRAYRLMDNRSHDEATWDIAVLKLEMLELKGLDIDLSLTGFDLTEIAGFLKPDGLTDPDAAPAVPVAPVSRPGDLWILGDHRLLCGDSTGKIPFGELMVGQKADMIFTDPPYNVDYEGYTDQRLKIGGDKMSAREFERFLGAAFERMREHVKAGSSMYVCHGSSYQREFQDAIERAGFEVRCQIIWAKNTFAWGFGRYKFQHEPMFYCHVHGQSDAWYGDKTQSTLWHENKPNASRLHPTMKPVELMERALANSSKAGDLVVDPFGGSGSTLIACERTGRRGYLLEFDPRYVDVIIARWEGYSGKLASLAATNTTFEQTKFGRRLQTQDELKEESVASREPATEG